MCKVIKMQARGKSFKVADIKQECVENIINAASTCDSIDKIILFGSSITNKCKKDSDVDIAVYGSKPKAQCLSSKTYREFTRKLYQFDDFSQSYDIIYFQSNKKYTSKIADDIENGELIYAKG